MWQVSQALAYLQAEHKQRFAVPGSAADQPTADAASEGEAPSIGLQRSVQPMPREHSDTPLPKPSRCLRGQSDSEVVLNDSALRYGDDHQGCMICCMRLMQLCHYFGSIPQCHGALLQMVCINLLATVCIHAQLRDFSPLRECAC